MWNSTCNLSHREILRDRSFDGNNTKALFKVPSIRLFTQASCDKFDQSRNILSTNFTVFKQFLTMFSTIKDVMYPGMSLTVIEALRN
jgi:hypothetical protein